MDNFGFQTQGKNYNKFRPQYPSCLYNYTIDKLKMKNRYLDVAMGTGQLLFNIMPLFKKSKGIDISDKMLETSKEILNKKYSQFKDRIIIEKSDIMGCKDQQKYDLITVGQALHWFPVRQSLQKMKNFLNQKGKLLVLSYVVQRCQQKQNNQQYTKFYKKVKPLFDFDRDQLQNHYGNKSKYPFEQIFPNVIRFDQEVKISMPKENFVNYLKTYSGYNQFLLKFKEQKDPIEQLEQNCLPNVTVVFDYFKIQCGI